MAPSVLALPVRVVRVGGKLAKRLALPMLAVSVVRRTLARRSSSPPGSSSPPASPASSVRVVPEPQMVVDPVPLAEPAQQLDVEVTLASDLPIRSYDALAEADAERAIGELTDAEDVRTVLRFEEENAKRSAVLTTAQEHLATLAVQA